MHFAMLEAGVFGLIYQEFYGVSRNESRDGVRNRTGKESVLIKCL